MAFQRETQTLTTKRLAFDPVTGWELIDSWRFTGSNYSDYDLRHRDNRTPIHFSGSYLPDAPAAPGWRVLKVHAVNNGATPRTDEEAQLIRDAMSAIDVEVVFAAHDDSAYLLVFMDCAAPHALATLAEHHLNLLLLRAPAGAEAAKLFLDYMLARANGDAAPTPPDWTHPDLRRLAEAPGRRDKTIVAWGAKRENLDAQAFVDALRSFWQEAIPSPIPGAPAPHRLGETSRLMAPLLRDIPNLLNFQDVLVLCEDHKQQAVHLWKVARPLEANGALTIQRLRMPQLFRVTAD